MIQTTNNHDYSWIPWADEQGIGGSCVNGCICDLCHIPTSLKPHVCPVCSGTGQVSESFYSPSHTAVDNKVSCRSCDGSGIVWNV